MRVLNGIVAATVLAPSAAQAAPRPVTATLGDFGRTGFVPSCTLLVR